MSSKPNYKCQGDADNLCGIYASLNSIIKATDGIIAISQNKAKALFEDIISHLHHRRLLYKIHQHGSTVKHLDAYLTLLEDKLAEKIKIYHYFPFSSKNRVKTVIKRLTDLSSQKQVAIILPLEGKYYHWSLVDKIVGNRIYLIDSGHLQYINVNKIPDIYQIIPEEVCVVVADKGACK